MKPSIPTVVCAAAAALLVTSVVLCLDPLMYRRSWDVCSAEEPFFSLMAVPIQTCVLECQLRPACAAVNYWRRRQVCEMLLSDERVNLQESTDHTCVFIKKSDIQPPQATTSVNFSTCATCGNHTVCDVFTSSCVIKECRKLRIDNAVVHGNRLQVGSTVKIACNSGHSLDSPWPYSVCQADGTWNNTPSCTVDITCSSPPTVANAASDIGDSAFGSVRNYTCDPGFVFNGTSASVTCGKDGNWTAVEFQCLNDCNAPPVIQNALVSPGNTTVGSVRTYSCSTGYVCTLMPGMIMTTRCQISSNWTDVLFECVWDCGSPPGVDMGLTDLSGNNWAGTVKTYTCATGYGISGNASVTCQDGGNWTPPPTCIPLSCETYWTRIGESCYLATASARNISSAKDHCNGQGGYLLQTETKSEFDALCVRSMLLYTTRYWLGLTDEATDGTWLWMETSVETNFSKWEPNQPDGDTGENYVMIYNWQWYDQGGSQTRSVICEKSPGL